jgi:hypothetical protein
MAHQYHEQLGINPELQAAVMNTVGNYICFRLGYADAKLFVHDIFQPEIDQVKDTRLRYQQVEGIEQEFEDKLYRGQDEIWEHEIRKLTELQNREFWYKKRGPTPPAKLRSLFLPDIQMTPHLQESIDDLVALSNSKYARPKSGVRREIAHRERRLLQYAKGTFYKRKGRPPNIFGNDPPTKK